MRENENDTESASKPRLLLSVIIPVYNKEDSLEHCVSSTLSQFDETIPYEIILVDDGSTDDSAAICARLAAAHEEISLIQQENAGVSSARNVGMLASRGIYALFLDADDQLSPGSATAIIDLFRAHHEEIDLITYPIAYVDSRTGTIAQHKREKYFQASGIYDLEANPWICQTTMNICVKRSAALAHPFSTSLRLGEDQLFISTIVAMRGAIGYCAEATYLYTRNGTGASTHNNKPVYAFKQMIQLYNELLALGRKHPKSLEYCRQIVLYNFKWRLASGALFPDFGDSNEQQLNHERLRSIARSIPPESYFQSKHLTACQKKFLLSYFDLFPSAYHLEYAGKTMNVVSGDQAIWTAKTPYIRIVRCVYANMHFHIMGTLEGVAFALDSETPHLQYQYGSITESLHLRESSRCYTGAHEITTRSWYFILELPLGATKTRLDFSLRLGETPVELSRIAASFTRTNARIGDTPKIRKFSHGTIRIAGNHAFISPINMKSRLKSAVNDVMGKTPEKKLRRTCLIAKSKSRHRRIWLYSDLPTSCGKGNALLQILHDIQVNDGVARYYITAHRNQLETQYAPLKGHLVDYRSTEHLQLYLQAEAILASYLDIATFAPCNRAAYDIVGDLSCRKTMIYLQHGILHAHIPWYFSFDRILFDYEVVSTQFEVDNLTTNYYFPNERLLPTGAPRMDDLTYHAQHKRKILYAPSWRSFLIGGNARERIAVRDRFVQSAFFQGMSELVGAIAASGLLERFDYTFELKLHPNFAPYKDLLNYENPRITLADESIEEADYAIMITDYSSYLYDFIYTGAQIIRFLPDRREFEGGANHYTELDLPPNMGLEAFAETPAQAIRLIADTLCSIESGAAEYYTTTSTTNVEGFFLHADGRNADRLYERIIEITDIEHQARID